MKNYYDEINILIEELEVNKKIRELKDNSDTLRTYWEIGKNIVDAQGGLTRAKYGDGLIKEWSINLTKKYGSRYSKSNLSYMRQLYIQYSIFQTLSGKLSWSHIVEVLPIKDNNERNYYLNQVILNGLGVRDLRKLIKNKTYDRLSYNDKNDIKLISDVPNTKMSIKDMIKDPILIDIDNNLNNLEEKVLHKYIIDMLENKFLELGY